MSLEPAIRLERALVRVGTKSILGPLDLAIEEREHVVIVGRSGAGKTTLLRVVAGLQSLDDGRVSLGRSIATDGARLRVAPQDRGVGMLFQGGALWPHMSVAKTLDFVLRHRGVERSRRATRIAELLEQVELVGFDARKPGTLSGGEAQRLALARALAMEPKILLLDEPLGPLDAELRASMIRRLHEVHLRLGLTTLHVTHDPSELAAIATRVLRLSEGRTLEPDVRDSAPRITR